MGHVNQNKDNTHACAQSSDTYLSNLLTNSLETKPGDPTPQSYTRFIRQCACAELDQSASCARTSGSTRQVSTVQRHLPKLYLQPWDHSATDILCIPPLLLHGAHIDILDAHSIM